MKIALTPINISKKTYIYSEYDISIIDNHDPKVQLQETIKPLSIFLKEMLRTITVKKINILLTINFVKPMSVDKQTGYFKLKSQRIINEYEIVDVLNEWSFIYNL